VTPKIFVGTMYSGENELAQSIASIRKQEKVEVYHVIVRDKRELEAHCDLYTQWNQNKQNFDMFVQVDADTVLQSPTAFFDAFDALHREMEHGYTSLQYPLLDHLTESRIMGLNFYSPHVIFNVPNDEVYCDRSTSNNATKLMLHEIGFHSPNPTYRQAFHFGLHRGLKGQDQKWSPALIGAFKANGDDRRVMALLGFRASKAFRGHKRTSYVDDEFSEAYVEACDHLIEEARKLST
jgi:hypothetical protein